MDGSGPDRTHWQGEPTPVWEALWGIPAFEAWTSLPSTNDRARRLAEGGAPAWTVVTAERQTAGRGRGGTAWQSEPGRGLWVSVVLRPRAAAQIPLLPLVVGIATARAIDGATPAGAGVPAIRLKWPNDLWLAGRKVGGILCESVGGAVVAGVGLNLRTPERGFAPEAPRAGSLEASTGHRWSAARVLGGIVGELRPLVETPLLRFEGPLALEWARRDLLRGEPVRVGEVAGTVVGVALDGSLEVERPDGRRVRVRAGTVEWAGRVDPGA